MSISDKLPFKLDAVSVLMFAVCVVAVVLVVRKLPLIPASIKP